MSSSFLDQIATDRANILGSAGEFTQSVTVHDGSTDYIVYAMYFDSISEESGRTGVPRHVNDPVLIFDVNLLDAAGLSVNSAMTVTVIEEQRSIRRVEPRHAGRVVVHLA